MDDASGTPGRGAEADASGRDPAQTPPATPVPATATPTPASASALGWPMVLLLVLVGSFPLLAALRAEGQGWVATGDVALIGMRANDVGTVDSPLTGQPTTGNDYAEVESRHPGPAQYLLLAPFTRALSTELGLLVGTAVLQGAVLAATVWLAHRRGGPQLAALTAVGLALLVRSIGAASTFDPMNSEVATYPMVLAVLAAWSVIVGDRVAFPALAAATVVAAQVHVSGAAFVALPLLVALLDLVRQLAIDPAHRRDRWRWLAAGAAILVVGWLPVLAQELSSGPSNVAALVDTASADTASVGLPFTVERLATAVAPVPLFVRSTGPFSFADQVGPLQVLAAFAVLGAMSSLALAARQRRARPEALVLAGLVTASTAAAVAVWAGTPVLSALRADGTRWLWVVSLLAWLALGTSGWSLRRHDDPPWARHALPIGLAATVLLLGAAWGGVDARAGRDGPLMAGTAALADDVLDVVGPGTYQLYFEGSDALLGVGPGVALRLEEHGRRVVVEEGPITRGWGHRVAGDEAVDGRLRIVTERRYVAREGEELIAEVDLDADAVPDAWVYRS